MFKNLFDTVWAFDIEWVPDQLAGRLLYDLPDGDLDEREILERMWKEGGASEDDPRPYLKTVVCRVISIAAVQRKQDRDGVRLALMTLPREVSDPDLTSERYILDTFLNAVGRYQPQLVGYNSYDADLKILIQRAIVHGVSAPEFNTRPDKPWEGNDYHVRGQDCHVDIKQVVSGWGKGTPSLNELATLSGIPGKFDMDGDAVAASWLTGDYQKIVDYNECDAVTTYLLFLRVALFGGKISPTEYDQEVGLVRDLLEREAATSHKAHFIRYLEKWDRLQEIIGQYQTA